MKLAGHRFTLLPLAHLAQAKLLRAEVPSMHDVATRTWQIAEGCVTTPPAAFHLPGQIERITGWEFIDEHPGPFLTGGKEHRHGPTRASLLQDAWLVDGVLYHGRAREHLRPRRHRIPRLDVDTVIDRGALYVSAQGNRWFGNWVLDDCPCYPLAEQEGMPIATGSQPWPHLHGYERILGMRGRHIDAAYFRQLVVFDDMGQNEDKHRRFRSLVDRVTGILPAPPDEHPGVFLLRGLTGERRAVEGERELAERLARTRGLTVIDPPEHSVESIIAACAGARCVVGIEGSHLAHAALTLRPGSSILTLQPPGRFVLVFKDVADRDGLHFGFVVGRPKGRDFDIDPDEVERTLDLFPQS